MRNHLAHSPEFLILAGLFQQAWAGAEAAADMAIRDFLGITTEESHLLTAGLEFNKKATLLRALISKSEHRHKDKAIKALNIMQNESKRNVFAHSYVLSNESSVTYLERSRGGRFAATKHKFTLEEFEAHVKKFSDASLLFWDAMGYDNDALDEFVSIALSINAKAQRSPAPPSS